MFIGFLVCAKVEILSWISLIKYNKIVAEP